MQEKLPSEQLEEFLNFLSCCKTEHEQNTREVRKFDGRQLDYLHDLEFPGDYKERCKKATQIHLERVQRREYKDKAAMVEIIAEFCQDKQNKPFIDKMRSLVKKQREQEEYLLGERHYNRRGDG